MAQTYEYEYKGIKVISDVDFSKIEGETDYYLDFIIESSKEDSEDIKNGTHEIESVRITYGEDSEKDSGEEIHIQAECTVVPKPFERIRRITGYLVGTTDRWNDGKKAELNDRVKHI